MSDKKLHQEEKLKEQVKSAVSHLRSEINNAFSSDIAPVSGFDPAGEEPEENDGRKMLKLTEYLLRLKEMELSEKDKELTYLYNTLYGLSRYSGKNFLHEKPLEKMITDAAALLKSDDAVLWVQNDGSHKVYATFDGAETYFMELLPHLVDTGDEVPHASHRTGNFAAYTHTTSEASSKICAMVFVRYSHIKFTKYELILVKILSDLIFSRIKN